MKKCKNSTFCHFFAFGGPCDVQKWVKVYIKYMFPESPDCTLYDDTKRNCFWVTGGEPGVIEVLKVWKWPIVHRSKFWPIYMKENFHFYDCQKIEQLDTMTITLILWFKKLGSLNAYMYISESGFCAQSNMCQFAVIIVELLIKYWTSLTLLWAMFLLVNNWLLLAAF